MKSPNYMQIRTKHLQKEGLDPFSQLILLRKNHQESSTICSLFLIMYIAATWKQVELSGQLRGALVEGLKPATKYVMRVAAEGPAGRSGSSAELWVTTEPQRPAGPPLGKHCSSSWKELSWAIQSLPAYTRQQYKCGFILIAWAEFQDWRWGRFRPLNCTWAGSLLFQNYAMAKSRATM